MVILAFPLHLRCFPHPFNTYPGCASYSFLIYSIPCALQFLSASPTAPCSSALLRSDRFLHTHPRWWHGEGAKLVLQIIVFEFVCVYVCDWYQSNTWIFSISLLAESRTWVKNWYTWFLCPSRGAVFQSPVSATFACPNPESLPFKAEPSTSKKTLVWDVHRMAWGLPDPSLDLGWVQATHMARKFVREELHSDLTPGSWQWHAGETSTSL